MILCATDPNEFNALGDDLHKFIIGSQGWSRNIVSENFDEKFSSVKMFEAWGEQSAHFFAEEWSAEFSSSPAHGSAAALGAFYYFHRDLVSANGNKSAIIDQFSTKRRPETSFYGLIATDEFG